MPRRKGEMPREGPPPIYSRPKPLAAGSLHCVDRFACDGVELEPARRAGGRCKPCMDYRMAKRHLAGAEDKRVEFDDSKLCVRSGMVRRISGTVMKPLPQRGMFEPVACVEVQCRCGTVLNIKRKDWERAYARPRSCAACRDLKSSAVQAARKAEAHVGKKKGRAA